MQQVAKTIRTLNIMNFAVIDSMGTKDTRLDEIEEGLSALNWSFHQLIMELKSRFPQYAEIANSTFFRWRNGDTSGKRKQWASDALDIIRESRHIYSKNSQMQHLGSTLSGIKAGIDKSYDLSLLMGTVEVSAMMTMHGEPFILRRIGTVIIKLSAMLSTALEHVILDGEIGQCKSGSVISFAATSYPQEEVYLLFRDVVDSDRCLIGWIPSQYPSSIYTIHDAHYPLADWEVIGYAVCVSWGPGEKKPQMRININGIGPSTRI